MCNKHSFLQDKDGRLFNGFKLTESHTGIAKLHGLKEDNCNKYEYNPSHENDCTYGIVGLKIDSRVFEPTNNDTKQIVSYIGKYFPNITTWTDYSLLDNPSAEMQLEAVKKDGYAIQYIKNPSEEMQLIAVKQNGYAIKFIKNPSKAVQLEAVKQDGCAIQYIKNPSEEMQLIAVKQNGYAIQYIKNPSALLQLEAVKENGYAIQFIKNPSAAVQLIAVNNR
jgi:hypothetical protein